MNEVMVGRITPERSVRWCVWCVSVCVGLIVCINTCLFVCVCSVLQVRHLLYHRHYYVAVIKFMHLGRSCQLYSEDVSCLTGATRSSNVVGC